MIRVSQRVLSTENISFSLARLFIGTFKYRLWKGPALRIGKSRSWTCKKKKETLFDRLLENVNLRMSQVKSQTMYMPYFSRRDTLNRNRCGIRRHSFPFIIVYMYERTRTQAKILIWNKYTLKVSFWSCRYIIPEGNCISINI